MTRQGRVADVEAAYASMVQPTIGMDEVAIIAGFIKDITGMKTTKAQAVVAALTGTSERSRWALFQDISAPELLAVGVTPIQANKLLAAIGFGKRVFTAPPQTTCVDEPKVAAQLLNFELGFSTTEKAALLILNDKHQLLAKDTFAVGSRTECIIEPAIVFEKVLRNRGSRFILAHCHPSGDLRPSDEDIALTRALIKAAKIINVPMLDHLILGQGAFASLRELRPDLEWDKYGLVA